MTKLNQMEQVVWQIAQVQCLGTIVQEEVLYPKMSVLKNVQMDTQLILKLVTMESTQLGMYKMEETVAMKHARLR